MSEPRDVIDRAARTLREPVAVDPAAKARLVAALRELPPPRVGPMLRAWRWVARPRAVMISPLAGLAAAAGLVAVMVLRPEPPPAPATAEAPAAPAGEVIVRAAGLDAAPLVAATELRASAVGATVSFRLHAPGASSVSLIGDFNDWDPARHPLEPRAAGDGVWELVLPLAPGRHVYSFIVDGTEWIADPATARAGTGELDAQTSVILVRERSL